MTLNRLKLVWILVCGLLLGGCARIQSGYYIQVQSGDSVESLANRHDVPAIVILHANRDKPFVVGQWYFVPRKIGINELFYDHPSFDDGSRLGQMSAGQMLWPVPSSTRISSHFGPRGRRMHEGIDIPARRGSHILAADDGVVTYSGSKISGYGKLTIVRHQGGVYTVYAHASKNYMSSGQKVYRGQVIAKVGNTGRSTGPHLHFEVRMKNKAVNPMRYVSRSRRVRMAKN